MTLIFDFTVKLFPTTLFKEKFWVYNDLKLRVSMVEDERKKINSDICVIQSKIAIFFITTFVWWFFSIIRFNSIIRQIIYDVVSSTNSVKNLVFIL